MVRVMINGEDVTETIKFPITPVGETSTVKMIVENNSEDDIELLPFIEDKDVKVDYKRFLAPREKMEAVWSFSPSLTRQRALNTSIGFRELIG